MEHPPRNLVIDWINTIWETDMPSSAKLVACCLRRYMNSQNDMAWPSVARIAGECGLSERCVQGYLKLLCTEGWIVNVGNSNLRTVKYQARTPAKIAPPAESAPPQKTAIPPAESAPELNKELNKTISNRAKPFLPPTLHDVRAYCLTRGNEVDPERFIDHYTSNGWKVGRNAMKDWQAAVRTWERQRNENTKQPVNGFKDTRRLSGAERTRLARERAFQRLAAESSGMGCVEPD